MSDIFSHGKTKSCAVSTFYSGTEYLTVKKDETDKEGQIFILVISIIDPEYILINSFDANTEKEQINVLRNLLELLEESDINKKQQTIAGDFNLLFVLKLDVQSGNTALKNKSLVQLIEFKEIFYYVQYVESNKYKI